MARVMFPLMSIRRIKNRSPAPPPVAAGASPSLAGMRAIVRAGLAATILPRGLIGSDLRVVDGEKDLLALPDVEYVVHVGNDERREALLTLARLIRDAAGRT